jgi:hypothetical protein
MRGDSLMHMRTRIKKLTTNFAFQSVLGAATDSYIVVPSIKV